MSFTALHQALGRGPGPFSLEMIDEAIAQAIEEDTNLDWKEALPHKEQKDKFAKDTAAMANSGGGVIVYGVKEVEGPSSAAGSATGVSGWGDAEERRLRQITYSAIQPPVHGLTFEVAEHGGVTVVAMSVPSSPEAPHLVWQKNAFVAPVRYGAGTEFMRERDLEQAYLRRFTARDDFRHAIGERTRQVVEGLDTGERLWMVGTAMPMSPRPSHLPRIDRDDARDIILSYARGTPFSVGQSGTVYVDGNPRAGLRRWRFVDRVQNQVAKVIEIHDDGGVTFAQAVVSRPESDLFANDVHPKQLQEFIGNFVWLSVVVARALQVDNSYSIRFTIESALDEPTYIRRYDEGFLVDRTETTPIHRFVPIGVSIEPGMSDESLLQVVRDLATDVLNQGGSSDLGTTFIKAVPVVESDPA